jgi:hypothetical protein
MALLYCTAVLLLERVVQVLILLAVHASLHKTQTLHTQRTGALVYEMITAETLFTEELPEDMLSDKQQVGDGILDTPVSNR